MHNKYTLTFCTMCSKCEDLKGVISKITCFEKYKKGPNCDE